MAKITAEEQPEYSVLPPDSIVFLKIKETEVREIDGKNGPWHKLEFTFILTGIQTTGDGSPVESYNDIINSTIWGSVPFKLTDSPENRLRQWVEAILGVEIGVGFELDTDLLKNRTCRGVTGTYNKKVKNPATGLPYQQHQVEHLLATGAGAPAVATAGGWGQQARPQDQPADPWASSQPAGQPANDPWASQQQQSWDQEPPF